MSPGNVQLRTDGSLPLGGGILLGVGDMRGGVFCGKCSSRNIGLILDAVKVRLGLLDVGGGVGVVVGLEMRKGNISQLEV
jgi:hypothetical protein